MGALLATHAVLELLLAESVILEHMFERAVSPVVRVAAVVAPVGRSEWLLAKAVALPPGPDAMRLLAGVDPDALDDVDRVEHLVAWERCARWVEAQRVRAVVGVAGAPGGGPGRLRPVALRLTE